MKQERTDHQKYLALIAGVGGRTESLFIFGWTERITLEKET